MKINNNPTLILWGIHSSPLFNLGCMRIAETGRVIEESWLLESARDVLVTLIHTSTDKARNEHLII